MLAYRHQFHVASPGTHLMLVKGWPLHTLHPWRILTGVQVWNEQFSAQSPVYYHHCTTFCLTTSFSKTANSSRSVQEKKDRRRHAVLSPLAYISVGGCTPHRI